MSAKFIIKKAWCIFDSGTRVSDLINVALDAPLWQFFLNRHFLFHSIFSLIFWLDNLHVLMKEFISLIVVAMEIGKRYFSSHHSNCYYEGNIFHQKDEPYRYKLSLKMLRWLGKCWARWKVTPSKMYILRRRAQKTKSITILHFMTAFYNLAQKIEIC